MLHRCKFFSKAHQCLHRYQALLAHLPVRPASSQTQAGYYSPKYSIHCSRCCFGCNPTHLPFLGEFLLKPSREGLGITFWKERISGQRKCSCVQLLSQPRYLALYLLVMKLYASALTTRFLSSSRTESTSY